MKPLSWTGVLLGCIAVAAAIVVSALTSNAGESPRKLRIIYTNDLMGYVESCGCGGRKDGGLARQVTAMSELLEENPNHVIVDSGNLSPTADKLDLITSLYSEMGYDAIGIGAMDDRIGDHYYTHVAAKKLTVLDARPGARDFTVPYLIKDVGGVKVGVVSFGAVTFNPGQEQHELRTALYSAFKTAREKSDILILLDQSNIANQEWLERNASRLGAPDIIIGGVANTSIVQERVIGRTRVMPTFTQCRALGVVDVEIAPAQDPVFSWRKVALTEAGVPANEDVARRIDELMLEIKKKAGVVVSASQGVHTPAQHTANSYYPPLVCKGCHIEQYDDWKKTEHAHAITTLLDARRAIPECLECHSEMFRRSRRIVLPNDGIGGVECATCHFDSLPHGMERKTSGVRVKVDPKLCLDCHTNVRSPDYDEATYMPRVSHLKAGR